MTLRAGAQIIKYHVTTVLADVIEKEAVFIYTLGNFGSHSVSYNTIDYQLHRFCTPPEQIWQFIAGLVPTCMHFLQCLNRI
jgi:hypothetical protein